MSHDYYKTLGVSKTASKDEIKKAFREQAHKYHPDKNTNDPAAAQKFKEASEAYSVLSDDEKRRQYDTFGQAGPGFNPGQAGFNGQGFGGFDFSGFQNGGFNFSQGGVEFDLGDIFGEFFGGGRGRRPRRGSNITVDVQLTFRESVFGTEKDIRLNRQDDKGKVVHESLTVTIPSGIENGQGLRVAGKGEQGEGGPGDLIVRVWVTPHASVRKEGVNLVMEAEVRLTTALAGGAIILDTLDGDIDLKIPAGTNHGDVLRIRGKGVPYETRGLTGTHAKRGDLLAVIHVIMPKKLSKNAQKLVNDLKEEGI